MKQLFFLGWVVGSVCSTAFAQPFAANATYTICFTPGQNCTQAIVAVLANAKKTIWVQAYGFTSAPLANALLEAKNRGVAVKVILDKSQFKAEKYAVSTFLDHHGIPVWIDAKPAIAHNKVMIVDGMTVVTGSFNFTRAAQEKNAENLLMIQDADLAVQYRNNWLHRQRLATPLQDYYLKKKNKRAAQK